MRLYSELYLNQQLDRLHLTPKQKDNVRYLIENIAYRYSKHLDKLEEENKELKEKLKGFENGDVAWQGDMDRTIKQNLELKAQIKKMTAEKL